ncbi:4Fe-4S dicluster domain-containing protein [Lactonifactor longoviformis]|uniref:Pyruvate ferredoxin oxidoreductase delta subunit n=1 Tax=Lactonifactor longoviformis DSM 17459 TaxID=1122155 RepID=A0A1M4YAR1_9CLOT|nr:4Fe-4S binding protein [Lactonifactor longoviformis]POP33822.1 4Fe-4S dicluster domain-containing protein [Lactonifactor longoviformis]SHF02907.1 pyruvate ferredoxin oxidoreductase delta subunit [Lactonifactor longoviformis DSM 17459]
MEKRLHITPIGDEGMYILDTASWRVYRPVMDKEKCIDCGMCLAFCPVNAVAAVGKKFEITYDYCKGCGICANECKKGAIAMVLEGGSR